MIELYNLAEKTYADLRAELMAALPRFTRDWTDLNYSDPGVTLAELLAWVTDTLLYRANRLPPQTAENFLRLAAGATRSEINRRLAELTSATEQTAYVVQPLNGGNPVVYTLYHDQALIDLLLYLQSVEGGTAAADSIDLERAVQSFWDAPFRATTSSDVTQIAVAMTAGVKVIPASGFAPATSGEIPAYARVARVFVDAQADAITAVLITGREFSYAPVAELSSAARVVYERIRKDDAMALVQYSELIRVFDAFCEPRRVLGAPFRGAAPVFTPVLLEVDVTAAPFIDSSVVIAAIESRLTQYLDPITGGDAGAGWPYNLPLLTEDVRRILLTVPNVASVIAVRINRSMQPGLRAVIGATTALGVSLAAETSGSYFEGLLQLERLIVAIFPGGVK